MDSTFTLPPHQARPLQSLLHPGVAQFDAVLGLQLLVKMSHIEIKILLPIESQHLLHRLHRHPFGTRLPPPPIK